MRSPRLLVVLLPLALLVAAASSGEKGRVYDLGHYPGGTYAEVRSINDSGLVVAWGDIPEGWTRPIAVPLHGPKAGQWFDLGTLGGERNDNMVMCMGVANTGMIVGHAALNGGELPLQEPVHGFAWTHWAGMVDLGTLPGERTWSLAYNVNRSGTLIVGWSGSSWFSEDTLPVVWTPKVAWGPGGPAFNWGIRVLDMTGFEDATYWYASMVNNLGQITGTGWSEARGIQMAFLWNPLPDRRGWKIMQLPVTEEYPNAYASDINERGEVVGTIWSVDGVALPALWKPANPRRTAYVLAPLASLPGATWNDAIGINDVGDIVGDFYIDGWLAARWSTRDPNFAEVLPFPGTWSFALEVNNSGIAVGSYGSDTIPENVAAVQIRRSVK